MISTGLVSVSFRHLDYGSVIKLAREAKLEGIEWGGDIHVPYLEMATAKEVSRQTTDEGLKVVSYGSYYWVGDSEAEGMSFEGVLQTAVALGAPMIRVWAGSQDPDKASPAYVAHVVEDAMRIAKLAEAAGVAVSFEAHAGTLTDGTQAAMAFLDQVRHPNLQAYWQPPYAAPQDVCEKGLASILHRLSHMHVFHKGANQDIRFPLAAGRSRWASYLAAVHRTGRTHYALLEFVRRDNPEFLFEDARTLNRWVEMLGFQCAPTHPK